LARLTLDDLTASLEKDPNDAKTLRNYAAKVVTLISPIARTEPEKAEELMAKAEAFLTGLDEKTEEKATEVAIKTALASIGRYKSTIEGAKKLLALIGTDAAKLDVEAWVNGKPLTDEDLKGKVVLLDFWAVWCGPCIATFPHLIEWDKKYDDLVIIGVTNYYNYTWDAEAKRAKRVPVAEDAEKVAPEVEQEMLMEFAKLHKLTHAFAVQTEAKSLSKHYGANAIPEAVVIDRTGKIRLIRVGSGEANAKALEEMIEKLIEE
jgi:thiol-disulfide isomerase/thioredoxin